MPLPLAVLATQKRAFSAWGVLAAMNPGLLPWAGRGSRTRMRTRRAKEAGRAEGGLNVSDPGLPVPKFRVHVFGFPKFSEHFFGYRRDPWLGIASQSFEARNRAFGRARAHPATVNLLESGDGGAANYRFLVRQRDNEGFEGQRVAEQAQGLGGSQAHVGV